MKEYTVYWIKEEFAKHYYYKNDILFRFIREYQTKRVRKDLVMQFNFITEDVPVDLILPKLAMQQGKNGSGYFDENPIQLVGTHNDITLHIAKKHLKFRCETLQNAEAVLFPMLRQIHPYIFIIDYQSENFGWISPARINIAYTTEQVLYS
ncbi:sporulation inhibitor of replication protein SirA [Ornithinibacillus contaminans]|uniref:sporulation inhibitor of replication protein SirA n=1 Tax=Ornithinibacillus contaminans TaxID=694055 RepID=UPI00064D797E|nr:sporulation inhibitor of replication protein SirA [Ornithinibacillus contaminans]